MEGEGRRHNYGADKRPIGRWFFKAVINTLEGRRNTETCHPKMGFASCVTLVEVDTQALQMLESSKSDPAKQKAGHELRCDLAEITANTFGIEMDEVMEMLNISHCTKKSQN